MANYLVWSNQHSAWWRANSRGYTKDLAQAGIYSRMETIAICAGARDGWRDGETPPEIPVVAADAFEALTTATAKRAKVVGDQFAKITGR